MKLYSPSQLITFIESPYASWHDRALKEHPEHYTGLKNEEDKLQSVLQKKGYEHEKRILEEFRKKGLRIKENVQFGEVATAIMEGYDVIYQAKVTTERFSGDADFIVKEPDGEYVIYDTKLAKAVKPYMIYQLCIYTEALSLLTGVMPKTFKVITGTGEIVSHQTTDYYYYFKAVEKDFLNFHDEFDISKKPQAENFTNHGNWSDYAEEELIIKDHLSLIANISRKNINMLESIGIHTIQDLIELTYQKGSPIDETILKLQKQAILQRKSSALYVPLYSIEKEINLPPKCKEDLYFDMEGYPLYGERGLEYLFGVTLADGSFIDFWAHNENEEKKAFCDFIDLAIKNFNKNPKMRIYHYASYEVTAIKKLSTFYGLREDEVDHLLRNEVFIDLFKVVKNSLIVGTSNYSIKSIEKCYRPKRSTDVATAGDSVIAYANWIDSGESKDWKKSPLLNAIRDYNKEDCDSTLELADWLRSLMKKHYKAIEKQTEIRPLESDVSLLRDELLKKYPKHDEVFVNLLYLLDFNKRKDKPMWWNFFDRYSREKVDFENDLASLSELHIIKVEKNVVTMKYDPAEETKIRPGDSCVSLDNITMKIDEIDTIKGILKAKVSIKKIEELKNPVTLIVHNYFPTKFIDERVAQFTQSYYESSKKFRAVRDFFNRTRPRLKKEKNPLVSSSESRLSEALRITELLDNTTLCLQGPPGTGKTYTASKMIHQLVKANKKVAIMSTSHKAIINLLNGVMDEIPKNTKISVLKIGESDSESIIDSRVKIGDLEDVKESQVVAATVYALCKCDEGEFDYLFIDEAGQVPLAHLIAAGMSAKNIILMGDQQQLPQPLEGVHPLETGLSLLDYYLKDQATIDDDFGIFLNTTYRMHSGITSFISKSIYEDKLKSDPSNDLRLIKGHEGGIYYLPVSHQKNSQASAEERKVIIALAKKLIGLDKTDKNGRVIGKVTLDDILFVAPYNLQVSLLSEELEAEFKIKAKVGSVDKFQGQEEQIVIVSMCTSDEEEIGSRGVEFLFSLNRLNVALTRAKSMAFIIASPQLVNVRTQNLSKMKNLNFWSHLMSTVKLYELERK